MRRPLWDEEAEDGAGGLTILRRRLLPQAGDLVVAAGSTPPLWRGLALVGLDQPLALEGAQRRVHAAIVQREAAAGLLPHAVDEIEAEARAPDERDRKSTRLNSSHGYI